ncbi:MAG: peptidylprolyl isomerase [Mediterranea massiliensis]|nr:peptidylprolyl isomerase [Mediterranea massiliensis]
MATLQNIRSKGPLLVIVIGLALFAFIAGDAWKVLQPHQSQDVGEINGEVLSAQEFQTLLEEYTEVVKFTTNNQVLTEEMHNQIKDEVWRMYVNNKLVADEAEKLGLTVSNAEIQALINAGTHPMLSRTPFTNPQTGVFDTDALKKFLVDYSKITPEQRAQMSAQYLDYYDAMFKFWNFLEKTLLQSRLQEKYTALIANSLLSNPVEAQDAFDARVDQSDILLAAIPYSAIPDSLVKITDADLKDAYNAKKEQFKQVSESRDIKFIDVQVVASEEDKAELQAEMEEYATQLAANPADYTTFIRSTSSETPYVDLFYTTNALPADVVARLDSVAMGGVFGPYYNATDNTLNVFKKMAKATLADSIEYRQIQVMEADPEKTKTLADSIFKAIKAGADFAEIAKKYGQTGEPVWISSANYEGAQIDNENLKYIEAVTTSNLKELKNLQLAQANIILQVTNKKTNKDKYKVAIVKRPIEFSKETYSKAYNDFSQFITANATLADLEANAEDAGYKLLERTDLYSSEHTIADISGTKDALRWVFEASEGEVSGLYECGDSDRMLVVAVSDINPEGYRSIDAMLQFQLRSEILRDKKAEKILADMKAANATTFEQYKAMENAVSDSVKHVTFSAPAYVAALRTTEPQVSAFASVAELNKLSSPIKGYGGVYVLQSYAADKLNETFDAKNEENLLQNRYARMATQQYMNDLYMNANVKDMRYIFF